ncbi:hypothetical protein RB2083_2162 [Rhodobacteraceae bacterium HTCC2083]|nr:hypothetical protein RB2083_2162 [Rhodobacteraceae bacterium HTCC2083]
MPMGVTGEYEVSPLPKEYAPTTELPFSKPKAWRQVKSAR